MKTKPRTIPALGAVAAAEADEKKKGRLAQALASIASALGVGEVRPSAKMSKKTETTKHTIVEESDTDSGEEEEEEENSSTDMTGSEHSESDAEEEEEESGSGGSEEEEEEERGAAEEEEEASIKGLGRALRAAYRSPAVKAAFLAAVPKHLRAAASLRAPDRIAREMRRATGAKTIDGAMTALSRQRAKAAGADANLIRKTAKLDARVTKVETEGRKARVEAVVQEAKTDGRASSRDLRAQLREYGMANGTAKLRALVATLPKAGRTMAEGERQAKTDADGNVLGAPGNEDQEAMMARATAGMNEKEREEFKAILAGKMKALNGAARRDP